MKSFLLAFLIVCGLPMISKAQSTISNNSAPLKQTIQIFFKEADLSISIQPPASPTGRGITPLVPLEFTGIWPTDASKLIIRLLRTKSGLSNTNIDNNQDHLRLFGYGNAQSYSLEDSKNTISGSALANKSSGDYKSNKSKLASSAAIDLDDVYDRAELSKSSTDKTFTVLMAAPGLRRYYGVEITVERKPATPAPSTPASTTPTSVTPSPALSTPNTSTSGASTVTTTTITTTTTTTTARTLPTTVDTTHVRSIDNTTAALPPYTTAGAENQLSIPMIYAGNLEKLPSERFIPYASYGYGFLKISNSTESFFVTSAGLIWTTSPIYSGFKNPFFHHYVSAGRWQKVGQVLLNRGFFSAGIGTTVLDYRGRTLATSDVKGTLGVGFFIAAGIGFAFEYTAGGSVNPNPDYDNRTKSFFMPGISLRVTGQVKDLFAGKVTDAQPK